LRKRIASPRAVIARLGAIVACVIAVAPPANYAWMTFNQVQQRADEQAALGARYVAVQLTKSGAIDWLTQVSIDAVQASHGGSSPIVASWVTDAADQLLMFKGNSSPWPETRGRAAIKAEAFTGFFHVAVSSRDAIIGTFQVSLAFLGLGLAAYYCFQRVPLSALDAVLRRLKAQQLELVAQKNMAEAQNFRFDAALNNISQGLCMFDQNMDLVVCNAAYVKMYDLPHELTKPGTPFRAIMEHRIALGLHSGATADSFIREILNSIAEGRQVTKVREFNDGRTMIIKQHSVAHGAWISTHEDVTEQRRIEARLAHVSRHDALTDLPNRVLLRTRLEEAIADAGESQKIAVLNLDIDSFKEINDTLGHRAGDALLRSVAERLRDCAGNVDTIARPVGDEFSILQVAADQPISATTLATRIIEAFDTPFDFNGQQVILGGSIGIAVSPSDGNDADQLLRNADIALHRAKSQGRGSYRFFEAGMDADMQARHKLQTDLRAALANGEFEIYYQPVVNLERNQISGLEALLRWHHPERGTIPPATFIPIAEDTGLIVPIGEWVLRKACSQAIDWPGHVRVAVNLSPAQFKSRNLVQMVFAALAGSGLPAQRLELEITESVLLQNDAENIATLHQLRSLGVRIALDDFGTGYSSLGYLRSFPYDKIKIDRSFVSDHSESAEGSRAILRAVATLGLDLGMTTTAEGVETQEQVDKVRAEGCTEMQGYFFSPPRPIGEISKLFLQPRTRRTSAALRSARIDRGSAA
jgi:diguanylate cyclase (GGDEF)-like protein